MNSASFDRLIVNNAPISVLVHPVHVACAAFCALPTRSQKRLWGLAAIHSSRTECCKGGVVAEVVEIVADDEHARASHTRNSHE